MQSIAVAFHFTAAFLLAMAALGGAIVAVARPQFLPKILGFRPAFAAGWLLVAAGEILHGAQFVSRDPSVVTVGLRGTGYLLIAGALAASWKADLPGRLSLLGSLALLVGAESTFLVVKGLHEGPAVVLWYVAHAGGLAAGILILVWLWEALRSSIQARFVTVFIILLLVIVVAISGSVTQLFASNIVAESLRRAAQEAKVQQRLLDAQVAESVSRARQVAELDSVRRAVADRDNVLAATVNKLQAPGGPFDSSDFMAFLDPSGAVLALSAQGANGAANLDPSDALSLAGAKVIQSALQKREAGSIDALGASKIGVVGAFPVLNPAGFDPPGAPQGLAGVVLLGRVIGRSYLERLADQSDEAFLITPTKVIEGTTPNFAGVLPSKLADAEALFRRGRVVSINNRIGGGDYFSGYVPLKRADGAVLGALVLSQRSTVLTSTQKQTDRAVFLIALGAALVAVVMSSISAAKITEPILQLTRAAERVRSGDLQARATIRGEDEVGVLGETFDEMAASLAQVTDDLRSSADAEYQLRNRLEAVIQSMSDGLVAIDSDGRIVTFNREAERILGVAAEQAAGRRVQEVLSVRDGSGRLMDLPIYDFRSGSTTGVAGPSPHAVPVAITSAPITNGSGSLLGGVSVLHDLTSQLEVEKMKTSFLSNVSHELRTPLTPIKGYSDILRRKRVPREKEITFLNGILSSAERLEHIVDMLVDFSAMEAGRLVPKRQAVDLNKVTARIIERAGAETDKHRFFRRGFSRLPAIDLDPKLVPAAIAELIDNAVKFSPKGGRITLTAQLVGRNGSGELKISVADQGIGIEQDQLSAISGSFSQLDESSTRAYGGLGLGLAYIKRIVEAYGGRLEVQSRPGRGSVFTMVFPAALRQGPKGVAHTRR